MVDQRQKVSDKDIISTLRKHSDPVLTTSEIAEELPIGQRATYNRLQSLSDEDQVEQKKVGARGIIWWPTDLEYTYQSTGQQALTPDKSDLLTVLDETDKNYIEKRAAVMEAFEYLRRNGEASRSEFYEEIFPDHPAGYENRRAWWEKVIRPSFTNTPTVGNASRGGTWMYMDTD